MASGRSGQRRCAWRGVVSARESVWDACEHGEVPRGGPGGAGWVPRVHLAMDAPWTRSTGGVRRLAGEIEHRKERDGGEGIFVISENPGTSR